MNDVIKIEELTKTYKNGRGIFDINLSVKEGEVYGLLGANGAGKTTLIKAMTRLLNIDSGKIIINDYDGVTDYEKMAAEIGSIIGEVSPYKYLTGYKNLRLTSDYFDHITDHEINHVLKQTGIYDYKDEKVSRYSTGMKQRLKLAGAILTKPKLLILDEPFSGMDIEGKRFMRVLINELVEEHQMTVLISSHQIGEIEDLCTRIGVIDKGYFIDEKTREAVLDEYGNLEDYYINTITKRRGQDEVISSNL